MSREDYEAISKIIEDVVGKDTLMAVKLLEGIKFYFDNRKESFKIIAKKQNKYSFGKINNIPSRFHNEAQEAMKRFTKKLKKENEKYKSKRTACKTNS
jgi:ABC-type Fe3+-hydroxamate transport system substrate-binding protein